MHDFLVALEAWRHAAEQLAKAEGAYARAYGAALAEADGRTESIRAGQAEQATGVERAARDLARIAEQAARWTVQYLMAQANAGAQVPRAA